MEKILVKCKRSGKGIVVDKRELESKLREFCLAQRKAKQERKITIGDEEFTRKELTELKRLLNQWVRGEVELGFKVKNEFWRYKYNPNSPLQCTTHYGYRIGNKIGYCEREREHSWNHPLRVVREALKELDNQEEIENVAFPWLCVVGLKTLLELLKTLPDGVLKLKPKHQDGASGKLLECDTKVIYHKGRCTIRNRAWTKGYPYKGNTVKLVAVRA